MSLEILHDGPLDYSQPQINDRVIFQKSPRRIGFGVIRGKTYPRPHEIGIGILGEPIFEIVPDGGRSIFKYAEEIIPLFSLSNRSGEYLP